MGRSSSSNDILYIGDASDNTVKTFDTEGNYLGTFVASGKGGLLGPRGMIFDRSCDHNLLVVNQKVFTEEFGNVLKFRKQTGTFLGEFVPSAESGAPFAPRGMVLSEQNVLFVADYLSPNDQPGELRTYNGTTGEFRGSLNHSQFKGKFHPHGVVIGPDGLLYVSGFDFADPLTGWVLRFDSVTGAFLDVFVESNSINNLHSPEGLVFGPDGNLYIISIRADENDTDKILIFNGKTGKYLDKIDLYVVGQPRAFARALLFGPNGRLFVPITGPFSETQTPDGPDTGSVRRYNVRTKTFDVFVPPASEGGPLLVPWYLTFGNTNPATLAYRRGTLARVVDLLGTWFPRVGRR
jgi:DNA-binding beta-propeller fold protein YncE